MTPNHSAPGRATLVATLFLGLSGVALAQQPPPPPVPGSSAPAPAAPETPSGAPPATAPSAPGEPPPPGAPPASATPPVPIPTPPAPPAAAAAPATPPPGPGFDAVQGLWGPARKSSGEGFRSMAEPLPEGIMRLRGDNWSLAVGGQYFARGDVRQNADFNSNNGDLAFNIDHRARVSVRASLFQKVGVLLELQDVRGWGSERSTTFTEPFTGLHQGFVDGRIGSHVDLRIGRQELSYGEDRLIGNLDWGQAARAFDGVWARFTVVKQLTIDVFGFLVRPPTYYDPPNPMMPAFTRFSTSGTWFYGTYIRYRPTAWLGGDLYILGLSQDPGSQAAGPANTNNFATVGARIWANVGPFAVTGEGAYQGGKNGMNTVSAWAFAAKLMYKAPVWGAPYVAVEGLGASGDGNATDGTDSTFNQLFPTGHIHLGYMDYVGWQNVFSVRGTVGFRPWGAHVWLDVHQFWMAEEHGAWYNAAGAVFIGADPLRTSNNMGTEVDFNVTIPVHKHVSIATNYSAFIPGAAAAVAPGSMVGKGRDTSHWAFLYMRAQF